MRFSAFLPCATAALFATLSLAQNITNNGIGSTPAQVSNNPSSFSSFPANILQLSSPQHDTNKNLTPHPLIQRHYVSASQASSIISAAELAATTMGAAENIAVVDLSGMLVAFLRMDNAFLGGIDLATKKARSIVLFNGYNTTALYAASLPDGGLYGGFCFSYFLFFCLSVDVVLQLGVEGG